MIANCANAADRSFALSCAQLCCSSFRRRRRRCRNGCADRSLASFFSFFCFFRLLRRKKGSIRLFVGSFVWSSWRQEAGGELKRRFPGAGVGGERERDCAQLLMTRWKEEEEEEDQKGFVIAMMTMDEFAQVLGISVGVLRYLLCFLASIPCSWLWRYMPNATTRHLYAAVTGALLSYFSFGAVSNVYFGMLMLVSYVSMLVSRRHCGSITFVLAFALLVTW